MAESSPVPLQIDAHTAHAFPAGFRCGFSCGTKAFGCTVSTLQQTLLSIQPYVQKQSQDITSIITHLRCPKIPHHIFCQGQEFHDPDWRLSVQQWWRSIAESSGTRISMTDSKKLSTSHFLFSNRHDNWILFPRMFGLKTTSWGNVCWFWSATMYWGGESIYGGTFNDEDFVRRHTQERCCQSLLPKQHLRTPSFFETLLCWQLHLDSQQRCFWCREAGVVSMANKGSKPRSFIFQEDSVHRNSKYLYWIDSFWIKY